MPDELPTITLTPAAHAKIKQLLGAEESAHPDSTFFLRFGVRPGGCSGLSYEMYFETEETENDGSGMDEIIDCSDGVFVLVDDASADLIRGTEIDYTDTIGHQGFTITNPNAHRSCGCGQSFS